MSGADKGELVDAVELGVWGKEEQLSLSRVMHDLNEKVFVLLEVIFIILILFEFIAYSVFVVVDLIRFSCSIPNSSSSSSRYKPVGG